MAHDDIRARLAACPIAWATEDQKFEYTKHYRRDVAALLKANEALSKALREVPHECYCEAMKRANVPDEMCTCRPESTRRIARAALAGAETGAEGGYE